MAFPIVEETPKDTPVAETKERVVEHITKVIERIPSATTNFIEALTTFIIAFWYFSLTPIVILFKGKNVPKEWLDLATKINKERIAKKIEPPVAPTPEPVKNKYKVVDLDTKKPVPISV